MTWHSLPVFVRLAGRPVILLGEGDAADAKRRVLERAGAVVVDDHPDARLAIVAFEDAAAAVASASTLKKRGLLVNAVDRPELCDFTLPAIVDRSPVLVAVGTGGVSAGLAAAVRQRLEGLMPAGLGRLAEALFAARGALRARWPDPAERRRALARAMAAGGALDPLRPDPNASSWLASGDAQAQATGELLLVRLASPDPDDLTLRQARALAQADRVVHAAGVPPAILARARADAARSEAVEPPADAPEGLTVWLEMAT